MARTKAHKVVIGETLTPAKLICQQIGNEATPRPNRYCTAFDAPTVPAEWLDYLGEKILAKPGAVCTVAHVNVGNEASHNDFG
jgi:hypothetical protein